MKTDEELASELRLALTQAFIAYDNLIDREYVIQFEQRREFKMQLCLDQEFIVHITKTETKTL